MTDPLPTPAFETARAEVWNVAVTFLAASMVTAQVDAVPLQAPDQPINADRALAVAVSVTIVPGGYGSTQSPPHAMPAMSLVTGPLPFPALETVNVWPGQLKVAVASLVASRVTTHVGVVPLHAPAQPPKTEPELEWPSR